MSVLGTLRYLKDIALRDRWGDAAPAGVTATVHLATTNEPDLVHLEIAYNMGNGCYAPVSLEVQLTRAEARELGSGLLGWAK